MRKKSDASYAVLAEQSRSSG